MPLLPNWILENILDLLVLPKLTLEVEEWNPLTDTVPIHTWIHPWLPLLRKYIFIFSCILHIFYIFDYFIYFVTNTDKLSL